LNLYKQDNQPLRYKIAYYWVTAWAPYKILPFAHSLGFAKILPNLGFEQMFGIQKERDTAKGIPSLCMLEN
jgi:hypothetical protein